MDDVFNQLDAELEFEEFLKFLKKQEFYNGQISHIEEIPKKEAKFGELTTLLNKRLTRWLEINKIRLWKHQAEAINSISEKKNTIIVTSTASGKSLCYNMSIIQSILENPSSTAIYIFPTKALARDQYFVLKKLLSETNIKQNRVGVYDGDVGQEEKRQILSESNIIITNPYGLHYYLPWFKQKWWRICKNLKYIILDEVHIYRGIFGSNFALLLRRLKRLLETYNVKPQWILSSATIHDPKGFAEKLVGEEFTVIDDDASPSGAKKVILWDLPFNEVTEKYRSAHQETKNLFVSHLMQGIQTLTFTLSRKMAELQAIWTRQALPQIRNQIQSYRAGISKAKRREIEESFKNKKILGISSTNALELGIDIGSLKATISSGFPGTVSSFKQQIGRSGRGEELSISTLIPMENPLDLFYIHNPKLLFGPIMEEVLITLNNKYILKNHLCCASREIPLNLNEGIKFGVENTDMYQHCIDELVKEGLLNQHGNILYWNGEFFPNERFNLNNLSDRTYKILLKQGSEYSFLTAEDESYVFRDLHPGAVYLYEAETYVVKELDLDLRQVIIKKKDVDYYTQSLKHTDISPIEILSQKKTGPNAQIEAFFGNVKVEHEYYSFKVIDTISQEIKERRPLTEIPLIEFETQAVWFLIPFEFQKEIEEMGRKEGNSAKLGGTIHALEHAMIAMAPTLSQISRWDLGGVSIDFDPVKQQPIIYIYDAFRGGIGISEALYQNLNELLEITYNLIKSCSCKSPNGCPGCCLSPKCGNNNEPIDKQGAFFLLSRLLNLTLDE